MQYQVINLITREPIAYGVRATTGLDLAQAERIRDAANANMQDGLFCEVVPDSQPTEAAEVTITGEIDMTPTWSAIGNLAKVLIRGGDVDVALKLWPEIARACAMAQALTEINREGILSAEQWQYVQGVIARELKAQGVAQ